MSVQKLAILFPGQGAYYNGVLSTSWEIYPQITQTFAEIDKVAKQEFGLPVSDVLLQVSLDENDDPFEYSPSHLQFALYGIDVAIYKILEACGLQPDVLVGHSLGEIAALVCAGAFTVQEGAFIVAQRVKALQKVDTSNGYMAALEANTTRVKKLLDLMGNTNAAVAVENYEGQTVVSGTQEAMDDIGQIAQLLKISFARLNSPYPFHNPLLQPAVSEFAANIGHLKAQPLNVPVFSPILQRYYNGDDVLTDCLAQHLVLPLAFRDTIQRLYTGGIRTFVECGALNTLAKLTKKILQTEEVDVLVSLDPKQEEIHSLNTLLQGLEQRNYIPTRHADLPTSLADILLPGVEQEHFKAFWTVMGRQLLSSIKQEYEKFTSNHISTPALQEHTVTRKPTEAANQISGEGHGTTPPQGDWTAMPSSREALFQEISQFYAEALEYPIEVFSEEVELEAELGIDSVKQTELLTRISKRYQLPPRSADFRPSNYDTLGKVVSFVFSMHPQNAYA